MTRFVEATNEIPNLNPEVHLHALKSGLRPGKFQESIVIAKPKTLAEFREKATTQIEFDTYTPFNTKREDIVKDILHSKLIKPPSRAGTYQDQRHVDKFKYCAFHQKYGHTTDDCVIAKDVLEKLARQGLLDKYIDTRGQRKNTEGLGNQQKTIDNPRDKGRKVENDNNPPRRIINCISGGFAGGGCTSSARKRSYRAMMTMTESVIPRPNNSDKPGISFNSDDYKAADRNLDDPVVISAQVGEPLVKKILMDPGSSADVLFYSTFQKMNLCDKLLQPSSGELVGFSGERVSIRGYIWLKTTFGDYPNSKTLEIQYLVVDCKSPYNIILGRPSLNAFNAVISTVHLCVKFISQDNKVVTIHGDQKEARQCYNASLKNEQPKHLDQQYVQAVYNSDQLHALADLDPRTNNQERPMPLDDLTKVQLASNKDRYTYLGNALKEAERTQLVELLRQNIDLFAWTPADMPGIDPNVICHKLAINPSIRPIAQKKRHLGTDKRTASLEETQKLLSAGFIKELKYSTWLANVVMVKKNNGKWRIFMDAYSGYNQILMHEGDQDKTAFITDNGNFCYKVMSFGLKNAGATYQRLMDKIFSKQIGRNIEVYVDDMVAKSTQTSNHADDLTEIFQQLRKYNMKLNPEKCAFGVQSGKFLGFMLTCRGIEANPEKCQAILNMRSPRTIKEVQQLTGRLAALARFLPCIAQRSHHFFKKLRKQEQFHWSEECEIAFTELKTLLTTPPILRTLETGKPLYLYLSITYYAISSVLVTEIDKQQHPVYFVSKSLQGAESRYPKLERLALALVITARRLRHYFQSHTIIVRTEQPLRQILTRPELAGRLIKWSIELSEYDIQYQSRGAIKSQALADFVAKLTQEDTSPQEDPWTLYVDGASNSKGSGAGILLENSQGIQLEQSLQFTFQASNNQAEYEALIAGLCLAQTMGITKINVKCDSLLVVQQVTGNFQVKDPLLEKYNAMVNNLIRRFDRFDILHIPREQNNRADLLSKLATTRSQYNSPVLSQLTLDEPSVTLTTMASVS
ncbi:uncharacterized protein LOC107632294 [Arachis ipaensis]|uniref:uncharacterized protein LOC107632294 n=1 Tax=Arachis ipaensis TaxID=130454 RepID=UPI0007AF6805|nr:uncharacterized protein LOC107632294 [Arachis ipaensis]XP_025637043.1 uncharacterized protein LOC112732512 [Arachis hypogaea]